MGTWRYSSKSATRAVREIYKQNVALLGILVAVSILFTLDLGTLLPGLITLVAGQKMWGNRFGNLTAIRFPIPTNIFGSTSPLTPALSPSAGENRPLFQASEPAGQSLRFGGAVEAADVVRSVEVLEGPLPVCVRQQSR